MLEDRLLRETLLFRGLALQDWQWIEERIYHRAFGRDQVIFYKGDTKGPVFIIKSGRVKICVTAPDGRESVIALLSPGDCFGELAALDNEPRSADAVAMEPTETWCLAREDFSSLLERSPLLARRFIALLSRRLRETDEHFTDLVFFDVFGRVARKLLELAEAHGVPTPEGGVEIALRLTQQDLANLVGTTRESVNKALRYYRRQGYISLQGGRITILSRTGLERRLSF